MAPTRDGDEERPGQAAADRTRETLRASLDRFDRETTRALSDYDNSDRESITEVHLHIPEQLRRPREEQQSVMSMPVQAPPKPVAKFLSWFPPHWRPWLLLGLIVVGALIAWRVGALGTFTATWFGV